MNKIKIMKAKQFLMMAVLMLCFVATLYSCTDSDSVGDKYTTFTGQTIEDFLDANSDYSDFEKALDAAGALSLMSSYGKYTCFLPNNAAVEAYVKEHGFSSFQNFLDSVQAVKQMVYYQIIDGESNGVGTYYTTTFKTGNIETKNMFGRYLYTTVTADGTSWIINNTATITSANNVMVNGVVHLVDHVVEGNVDVLPAFIESEGHFNIYAEALKITGLRDSLLKIEDDSYVQPTKDSPAKKEYGYTALLETDSVLALHNITDVNSMRAYAEKVYPAGKELPDTARLSSLNLFVAYHFLPAKMTSSQLCPTKDFTVTQTFEKEAWQKENFRDGKFSLDNYLFPLAPNTLINVQQFAWRDGDAQKPIFNDKRNPYSPEYTNMVNEVADVNTLDMNHSNLDCLNGVVHALTNMLVYDESIYHKRLRMDFSSFFPEMWNNDLLRHESKGYRMPLGYCKNITFDDKENVNLKYWTHYGGHSYYWGDMFIMTGRCNVDLTLGPIPSGKYEVRIGYLTRSNDYGIVQYYIDGEPCGIPLDQTLEGRTDPSIGWTQVWWWCYGGGDDDPYMGFTNGKETEDDFYGFENDKSMHNRGYMKGPDSYCSKEMANGNYNPVHTGTARNSPGALRRVLKIVNWSTTTTHTLRISNLMDKQFTLDYIEFIPTDLIENEDTH
jgi:uncharacterized surface protein with fasciclin (FAS1) repeats